MTKTVSVFSRAAIAAAVLGLGLAGPALAQTAGSTGPQGSTNAGVKTPSSGGNEVSPSSGPLPGKSSTSVMPDRNPKSVNEAGDARPEEKTTRMTPPAGSASAPNPKTPLSVNEGGDPDPLKRQGATAGKTRKGTLDSSTR